MTPKEKAQDLINKFHQFIPLAQDDYGRRKIEYKVFNAKECALICVNEIIQKHIDDWDSPSEYWEDVKTELEKL